VVATEQYIFGYGSLTSFGIGLSARLEDHRRVWGVAMDNRMTIRGYKYYRLPADGTRPAVFVAFLDMVAEPRTHTDGVLLSVDDATLRSVDRRERNYDRFDVTASVSDAPGRIWAYRGTQDGRERLRLGRTRGTAVVDRTYRDSVLLGFAEHGIGDDLDTGGLPLIDLERVDLSSP